MTNIGTIPGEGFIQVVIQNPAHSRGTVIGKIDELFLERMKRGDIFVLGGEKYQYLFARGMKAYVSAGVTKNPTIPSWYSEMLPLHFSVGLEIGKFRKYIKERLKNREECLKFIIKYIYCKEKIAIEIYNYFKEQESFSEIPDEKTIVIERFKQDKDYLVFHSGYGRRVNDALARAFGFAAARLRYRDIELGVDDRGFFISGEEIDDAQLIAFVNKHGIKTILKEAVERTELLGRRFRHCAARSLMILRNYKGREKSVGKQQMHSGFLLTAVKKLNNEFPILREARREVFEEVMDVAHAQEVLDWINMGKVKIVKKRLPFASPFALKLMIEGRSDLIKMEDRANFLKRMHELHLRAIKVKEKNKTNN
jgi:ATP-dependent Lhr-like helicase